MKCSICHDPEVVQFILDWCGGMSCRCRFHVVNIDERKDLKNITREEALVASVQGE